MQLNIDTLAYISSLTFLTQFIALLVQYIVNRTYRGVQWWLLGSTVWALGVILLPLVTFQPLELLARIANPLIVLGLIFFDLGINQFLNKSEHRWLLVSIYAVFICGYYYFMLVDNQLSGRSAFLTLALTVVSFLTAARLFFSASRRIYGSANFTAFVFFAFGCFSAVRVVAVLTSPPMHSYSDQWLLLQLSFIVPIITSLLWTFGFIIMMNQRLNAENREEKEKLQLIFNTSPDAAIISRLADGLIVDVNAGFVLMTGYSRAELIGNTTLAINVWHTLADRQSFVNELYARGICENMEFTFRRKDGSLFTGRMAAKVIPIQKVPHIVTVVHDITQSKLAEAALQESEELYRSILNASPDDITITDLAGHILVISPAAKTTFGYAPDYDGYVGSHLLDYLVPEDRERAKANIVNLFKGNRAGPHEYRAVRNDGTVFDIEVNSGLIHGVNRQPAKLVFVVRDITGRKRAEQQIQQLVKQLEIEKQAAQSNANTDSLTGLANRRYFDVTLTTEFYRLRRSGLPLSLIMFDVDRFKGFNDSYGHLAGDDCLRQIALTLKAFVGRVADLPARYGGDEFFALLPETDSRGATELAERLRQAVEALAIPHAESDIANHVTISLGVVTVYTARLASPEQVVALADEALYSAKAAGRNRTSVATEDTLLEQLTPLTSQPEMQGG